MEYDLSLSELRPAVREMLLESVWFVSHAFQIQTKKMIARFSLTYNLRRESLCRHSSVVGRTVIFQSVSASSREEAVELLDEVGNADVAELFTAKRFMVHLQLKRQVDNVEEPVPVDLESFGEETYDSLHERVYPVYNKASTRVHNNLHAHNDVPKEEYEVALRVLNDALAAERMRSEDSKKPELSDNPDVAKLQK